MKQLSLLAGFWLLIAGCAPEIPDRSKDGGDNTETQQEASNSSSSSNTSGGGAGVSGALGVTTGQDQFDVGQGKAAGGNAATSGKSQTAQQKPVTQVTFGRNNAKLVDAQVWKARPKVVEVGTKITGQDPLTASMQAMFSIGAKAQMLAFKHNLDIWKQTNDLRNPSFKEFAKMVQDARIQWAAVYPWQAIGYDSQDGRVMLLEDKADKIKRYKEKGIPLEEADKAYDN